MYWWECLPDHTVLFRRNARQRPMCSEAGAQGMGGGLFGQELGTWSLGLSLLRMR